MERSVATKPETPDPQFGELRFVPDEPTERDVRLGCLHAAIQIYRPGEVDAEIILRTAELFYNFANGVNLPAPVQA
jgi:hypothetical protein